MFLFCQNLHTTIRLYHLLRRHFDTAGLQAQQSAFGVISEVIESGEFLWFGIRDFLFGELRCGCCLVFIVWKFSLLAMLMLSISAVSSSRTICISGTFYLQRFQCICIVNNIKAGIIRSANLGRNCQRDKVFHVFFLDFLAVSVHLSTINQSYNANRVVWL